VGREALVVTYCKIHTHTYTRKLHYLPRSSWTGVGVGLPSAKCMWTACGLCRGCTLDPPNACCARWCAKSDLMLGPQWRKKVVELLYRGALSGARRVPPQQRTFWGCRDNICACLGQYIQYMQIPMTHTYTYIHICNIHSYTYIHMLNTYPYIQIHTYAYTYIDIYILSNHSLEGFFRCCGACYSTVRHYLPRSSRTGVGAGLLDVKCMWTTCGRRRGCTLGPPDACCARWCAKSGPGLGPR
jgi:hypothetical protein